MCHCSSLPQARFHLPLLHYFRSDIVMTVCKHKRQVKPDGENGLWTSRVQGNTKGSKVLGGTDVLNSRNGSDLIFSRKCRNKAGFNLWNLQNDIRIALLTQNKGPIQSGMLTWTVTKRQQVNLASFCSPHRIKQNG